MPKQLTVDGHLVGVAKDTSLAEINVYLGKSPMRGTVTLPDSGAWATYNPMGATPLFVVVDERGIVRFPAEGASAIAAVAASPTTSSRRGGSGSRTVSPKQWRGHDA